MNKNELKKSYKEFVNELKKDWEYNIDKTIFLKTIEPKGNFIKFCLENTRTIKYLEQEDYFNVFNTYIGFLLNENTKANYAQKLVKNNKYITHVHVRPETKQIFLISNTFKNKNQNTDLLENFNKIKTRICKYFNDDLLEQGFSKTFIEWLDKERKTLAGEKDLEDEWNFRFVELSSIDYVPKKSESQIEKWGLPSIFIECKFNSFSNMNSKINDNMFEIKRNISQSDNVYIDINEGISNTKISKSRILVFPVSIKDLVNFMETTYEKYRTIDSLFTLNVRDRKSGQSKVSKSIVNSLQKNPEIFFMLNNGITVIADNVEVSSSDKQWKVSIKNIKIINGQQTANTLFEHWRELLKNNTSPDYLDNANILFKVYKIEDQVLEADKDDIFNEISKASNSQNAIKAKDLLSTSLFNRLLQEELLKIGINYSYRDGKSDFSDQLKQFPKTTLNDLVKMHYIKLTGEVWKRGSIGSVFDSIVGLKTNNKNSPISNYVIKFKSLEKEEIVKDLKNIGILQIFYKNKKKDLEENKQALDLLIYISLLIQENGGDGQSIDVPEFSRYLTEITPKDVDRNNLYKSAKHMPEMLEKIKRKYL